MTASTYLSGRRRSTLSERGSAVVELTVLMPVFALLIGIAVLFGRLAITHQTVIGATADAARAASLRATADAATADADTAGRTVLDGACEQLDIAVDTSELRPGGTVRVDIACTVNLADLVGVLVPGERVLQSTAIVPIDAYRAGDPA
jgi:Flp pilus assembly protein TadG